MPSFDGSGGFKLNNSSYSPGIEERKKRLFYLLLSLVVHTVVREMGQLLSHPLTEKTIECNDYKEIVQAYNSVGDAAFTNGKTRLPRFYNCVGTMQGYRLTQEDAHLVINEDNAIRVKFFNPFKSSTEELKVSIFALFDGHGGDNCSNFLSGGHHKNENSRSKGVAKWIVYSFERHGYGAYVKVGDGSGDKEGSPEYKVSPPNTKRAFKTMQGLIMQILKDAFFLQDQELYQYFSNSSCGSTAVVAVIINFEDLYVVNGGDSRCILSSKSSGIKTMSFDHKPQHIGELLRINDNGGTVSLGRVGGVLALSRAFGDFQFKRGVYYSNNRYNGYKLRQSSGIPPQESQVTVEPDVLMHKIDYTRDEFLVLGCDGIWDIYSNKQLVQFIKYHLTLGVSLDGIVAKILDHGIAQANSNTGVGFDNMTVIIVVFNKPNETLQDWCTKMKFRLERERGLS